jgi:hypothetical protein
MMSMISTGHVNVCALVALCIAALGAAPALAVQTGASDMLRNTGEVHDLPAIDGKSELVYLDFNAPLERIVPALLRTSSYQWPYNAFEMLVKKHGRSKVREAIATHLRALNDPTLLLTHKGAAMGWNNPLSELKLPGDTWLRK